MPNRDRKLQELAAISQLYQGINGPQVRQQESQQQNALAILGLLMQQQNHGADRALQEAQQQELAKYHQGGLDQGKAAQEAEAKYHADVLAQGAKAESDRSNEYWGGTYGLEQQKLADTKDSRDAEVKAKAEADKQLGVRTLLSQYGQLPGMTPGGLGKAGQALGISGADTLVQDQTKDLLNKNVDSLKALFGPGYQAFGTNPKVGQQTLDAGWQDPRMQDPTVQAALQPWISQHDAALANVHPPSQTHWWSSSPTPQPQPAPVIDGVLPNHGPGIVSTATAPQRNYPPDQPTTAQDQFNYFLDSTGLRKLIPYITPQPFRAVQ